MLVVPFARADDDLGKFVEQNRILAQKVKTEAAQAMTQARALEKAPWGRSRLVALAGAAGRRAVGRKVRPRG